MNTKEYLLKKTPDARNIITYQNINNFSVPSLKYIGINPTHKILVVGRRKRKHNSHKIDTRRNYEKVAMILKDYYGTYIMALYITGVYLICTKLSLLY